MTDFELPAALSLGTVHLRVADVARASVFYGEYLGLHVRMDQPGRAQVAAAPDAPALLDLTEQPGARPKPRGTTGLFHVALRVPTRRALGRVLRQLSATGWTMQGAADHGVSEALYLADPDGNGLEIYRDRPREQWPMDGAQVAMVTERLDITGVLGAADDAPWDGIDPGTDIGHMHLSVSNLARTRAFYSDLLGFAIMQDTYPGALFMAAGGYHHHLGVNTWGVAQPSAPPPEAAGLDGFTIVLPDAWAWQTVRARLENAEVAFETQPANGLPRFTVRDPDQIAVTVVGRV